MEIVLSWDLFILIFFAIIVAYSFIVGKVQTIKIVLCAYLALLFADGMGNLIEHHLKGVSPIVDVFLKHSGEDVFLLFKVFTFVIITVFLTIRGVFSVVLPTQRGFSNMVMTFVFGVLCAGFIISTILIFVSGVSLINGGNQIVPATIAQIKTESKLVALMVEHYNWWFSMPALTFIVYSFFHKDS